MTTARTRSDDLRSALRFHDRFVQLFDTHFPRIFRFLDRVCGDADLAADLAQETFIRLCRRGSLPEKPEAWLISVAMNLFRNARNTQRRRRALLTRERGTATQSDPAPAPGAAAAADSLRRNVRRALERLPARERSLLLLRAEGYTYREIATALQLNEASVGTLLARARRAFREYYDGSDDAP